MRKLIAGNWKMNGSLSALDEVAAIAAAAAEHLSIDVALCLPATLIAPTVARCPGFAIGAQDVHAAAGGAHTGCLSTAMLIEAGARLVIVGHSERRADNHENSADAMAKAAAALTAGLTPIICVGETEAQRNAGDAVAVVTDQLERSLPDGGQPTPVIAYEPVWAIGTGRTPSLADVAEMHAAIRAKLIALRGSDGHAVRILYGGSVKSSNAAELLTVPNVNGALVGGASLKAADFIPIISAA